LPGGSGGSQKVLSEKSKVKFYFSTVRSRVIPILNRVEVGDYPSKIARLFGIFWIVIFGLQSYLVVCLGL
jgi:hypothetical protein